MNHQDDNRSTAPDDRLRAALALVCGPAAMVRIVDPVLADFRKEASAGDSVGRHWVYIVLCVRWTIALVTALALDFVLRPADAVERVTMRRMWSGAAVGCGVVVLLLWTPALRPALITAAYAGQRLLAVKLMTELLPSVLAVAIPCGVLFGALGSARAAGVHVSSVPVRPVAGVSLAAALLMLSLLFWIMPVASLAYRADLIRAENRGNAETSAPQPGAREMSYSELQNSAQADAASVAPGRVSHYDVERHRRLALAAACLSFGWFGAVLATTRVSRSRVLRVAIATGCVVAYYALLVWGARLSSTVIESPAPIWIANVVFVLLASVTTVARTINAQRQM